MFFNRKHPEFSILLSIIDLHPKALLDTLSDHTGCVLCINYSNIRKSNPLELTELTQGKILFAKHLQRVHVE